MQFEHIHHKDWEFCLFRGDQHYSLASKFPLLFSGCSCSQCFPGTDLCGKYGLIVGRCSLNVGMCFRVFNTFPHIWMNWEEFSEGVILASHKLLLTLGGKSSIFQYNKVQRWRNHKDHVKHRCDQSVFFAPPGLCLSWFFLIHEYTTASYSNQFSCMSHWESFLFNSFLFD